MDELSNHVSNKSRHCDDFDEDIFEDSIFLDNLESFHFKKSPNGNKGDAKEDLNVSALCCDEELDGYDRLTGQTWIYPTNYPVRDYQFNIIKAAMLKNCLVSLPTGLGKTFIAAVVMYNFYRWYPVGKIIFTAPTRPLVAQQIEACYNIVAMPPKDTIEMTGQMPVNTRKVHWQSKRVFFAMPQVIYNDIKSGMCPGDKIRCLVFDEAHKARGNYAYGNIISTLSEMGHKVYRVLALSATPGNKVEDVIHVVKRLHISHLELRTENCLDVKVYSHARKINTVVVELGPELTRLRQQYVEILDGYNRKLKNFNIVQNLGNLSKGRIVMLYKEFQSRERGARHPQHNYIMRTFTLLITLYHGLELLVKHGARVFLNFFDEHPEKTWVQFDKDLTSFFDKLRDQLGVNPLSFDRNILPDGTIPEIPSDLNFGHPKFDKLKEIMLKHFTNAKENGQVTKAIVFCEYRESVNLVHCLLLQCRPTIMPEMFVGHGSGKEGKAVVSQKQQLRVMRNFRAGSCNTLVCTCVAEEGLDVGAVDLILCFDVSTRSPVRLVQRCGRTGRERSGQVFILVTEGREHTTLLDCMRQSDGLNNRILQSEEVKKNLYKSNPRMVPRDFMPECQQMYITVKKELSEKNKKTKDKSKEKHKGKLQKGQQDLLSMFQNKASSSKTPKTDTKEEVNEVFPTSRECNLFSQAMEYSAMSKEPLTKDNKAEPLAILSSGLEFQRNLQDTHSIGHSSDAVLLTELLQHKHEVPTIKSPAKKDGDIRVLFSKTTKSIKDYTKSMKDLGINNNMNISTEVLNLLVDLSIENAAMVKPCYICLTVGNCSKFCNRTSDKSIRPAALCSRSQPVLPDINLIDNMSPELLLKLVNNDDNVKIDSNQNNNNSFSESRTSIEYSSPKVQNIETVKPYVDCNTEPNIHMNTIQNHNVCEDYDLFNQNDIFDNDEILSNLTPIESRSHLDGNHTIKRCDESTMSGLNTGYKNKSPNSTLQKKTIVTESQEMSDYDNIIEDIFEDFEMTSNESAPPMNLSEENRIAESTIKDDKTENNNASTELDSDIIIIGSQEICDSDIKVEDNDVLEDTQILNDNNNVIISLDSDKEGDIFENDDDELLDVLNNKITCPKPKLQLNNILHITERTEPTIQIMEDETDEYTISVLKYFRLNKISDIFQDSDVDSSLEKSVDNIGDELSLLPETGPKRNNKCDVNNQINTINEKRPSSPSLLSSRSSSPILISQKRKINLSINKHVSKFKKMSSDNKPPTTGQEKALKEPEHRKTMKSLQHDTNEIIIVDSDDDDYPKDSIAQEPTHTTIKRKFKEESDHKSESPYFCKKLKLNANCSKPSTINEKIIAALTSHQNSGNSFNNSSQINFMTTKSPTFKLKKENRDPLDREVDKGYPKCKIDILDTLQHGTKTKSEAVLHERPINVPRKITYNDDNDFITELPYRKKFLKLRNERVKNGKKVNEFLDVEAELSLNDSASADERSDDSAGSLGDFICDDAPDEDLHAMYLQSVKSPVKGVFKVPQLPPLNRAQVLSQYVEEDTYEMDSFCVDSHIIFNETNEMSELEIAEMILKERRKSKKTKNKPETQNDGESSPIIKKNNRNIKRQIDSDSEDSS